VSSTFFRKTRSHSHHLTLTAVSLVLLLAACDGSSSREPELGGADISNVTADLSNDALLAPVAPELTINVQPSLLEFSWDNRPQLTRTSLYAFDTTSSEEWLISDAIPTSDTSYRLPIITHQLPWHSRQYRIELCDANDCVSSLRKAVTGRALESIQTLAPAVSLNGEAFGQSVAINDNGSISVIAEPLAGSVSIYLRNSSAWGYASTTSLSEFVSTTRSLEVALSTSGDTIAVFSNESDDASSVVSIAGPRLIILERLGESWFATSELDLSSFISDESSNSAAKLYVSGDGERVLLSTAESLVLVTDNASGWQTSTLLTASASETYASSLGVSRALDAVHLAVMTDAGLAIQRLTITNDQATISDAYSLPMLQATVDIQLASSSNGEELLVFAWEVSSAVDRIPVAWQYQSRLLASENTPPSLQLNVERSLRLGAAASDATLRLVANQDLSSIIFAWQSIADANLIGVIDSGSLDGVNSPWQNVLELPQSAPVLAKNAFVDQLAMSHDGSVLMVSVPVESSASLAIALETGNVNSGQILVLQ